MTQTWRRGQSGFTLLELIISMALIGVIVLIIAGGMRLGFRSAESGFKKAESLERFRTSLNAVESQIQSAFAVRQTGLKYDEDFSQFSGNRSYMQFRTLYSLLGGSRGPALVTYNVIEDSRGGKTLFGTEVSIATLGEAREVRLIERAADIYFEYYDMGPTDEKGTWQQEWSSKDRMPSKVRLFIEKDSRTLLMTIPVRSAIPVRQIRGGGR
jgi:general secretion pathway protein J